MEKQPIIVRFDSGEVVEVDLKSRDIAKAERAGVSAEDTSKAVFTYALAFVAMQRMKRAGEIDFDLPENAEALEDIADIEEGEVVEGEDSGQAAVTG